MDITKLDGKTIYLDNLADLTYKGEYDRQADITLKETGGPVIIRMRRYPDFSGLINLDLSGIMSLYVNPKIPFTHYKDDTISMPLTITIESTKYPPTTASYNFSLVLLHTDARYTYSDIDFLRIPEFARVPVSKFAYKGDRISIVSETSEGAELLVNTDAMSVTCVHPFYFEVQKIKKNLQGRFRIAMAGNNVTRSPVYQPCPGQWQQYLFKNRLGFLEYFPMSGDIKIAPSYKFETAEAGQSVRRVSTDCDVVMQQYTGPLTQKASKALAGMLANGYAYHYNGGNWMRIIIEDADVGVSKYETICKHSFSFKYQQPFDIIRINI